jgi:hypothetical protein
VVGHSLELGVKVEEEVDESSADGFVSNPCKNRHKSTHANAAVEWPDIQLSSESSIVSELPVQMLRLYMMFWKPFPLGVNLDTSGWHTERKCGRRPPMSHLWNTWKTAAVTASRQRPEYI